MLTSQDRQRSKSARRIKIKSPLNLAHQISLQEQSQEKIILKKSKGSSSQSTDTERKIFSKNRQTFENNSNAMRNWTSTGEFKNKIIISSGEFNRLKQRLESANGESQGQAVRGVKRSGSKKLKIKFFDGLSKQTSNNSDKTLTNNKSTGSSDSEEIELLKVQNEYFKKIYDDALNELSKLQNKLKEEKKVHEIEKHIYENEIKKLKRIVDVDREEVSHIICDEENRYIIVVSTIDKNQDENEFLAINSDCEEEVSSLSIVSRQ